MIEQLKEIMVNVMPDIEDMEITDDTLLKDDLGLDSLALMMISIEIENAFGFRFEEFKPFKTVGEVCSYIKEKTDK